MQMQTMIRFGKNEFLLELKSATVIHADKYSETRGGWGNFPVRSVLYTDVVFNNATDGTRWQITIQGRNLPVYQEQNVSVILLEHSVIGFIDQATSKYYYTRNDFNRMVPIEWPARYFWISGLGFLIIGAVKFFTGKDQQDSFTIPFFGIVATLLTAYLHKWILNRSFTKAIDHYLQDS